jgi:hypothetical protein
MSGKLLAEPRKNRVHVGRGQIAAAVRCHAALDFRDPGGGDLGSRESAAAQTLLKHVCDVDPIFWRKGHGLLDDFFAWSHRQNLEVILH